MTNQASPAARRSSIAHLVIRPKSSVTEPVQPPFAVVEREGPAVSGIGETAESNAFLNGLRELLAVCGTNQHDRVTALITACIGDGVNTRARIVEIARALDFSTQHAAMMLEKHTGTNADRHRWQRDADGVYTLLG